MPPTWEELPEDTVLVLPFTKRPNRADPRPFADTAEYAVGHYDEGERRPFALKYHTAFRELIRAYLRIHPDDGVAARVLAALDANNILHPTDMKAVDVVVFRGAFDGSYLHETPSVREFWTNYKCADIVAPDKVACCACGRYRGPVRKVTTWIAGVPNSQAGGCSLVTANIDSAQRLSVGPRATMAGLCFECADSSHRALNAVLSRDRVAPAIYIGPLVTTAWAVGVNEPHDGPTHTAVRAALTSYVAGVVPKDAIPLDPKTRVRVLMLAAHQARGIVRRYEEATIGDLRASAEAFYSSRPDGADIGLRDLITYALPPTVSPTLATATRFIGALLFHGPLPLELRDAVRRTVLSSSVY
jgi:hypothetical protein